MKQGFTLIELLATLTIILMMLGLALSAYHQVTQAQSLSGAAQVVSSVLEEAHAAAQARNLPVEVRFYQVTTSDNPVAAYRALQAHLEESDGTTPGLAAPAFLPVGMVLDATAAHSPLLAANTLPVTSDAADSHLNTQTRVVHFLPDGSTDLDATKKWFVTIRAETASDPAHFPANWACVQVEATTGRVEVYRP